MAFKLTAQLFIKIILWIIFFSFLAVTAAPLMAQTSIDTTLNTRSSKSISYAQIAVTDTSAKQALFQQAALNIMPALIKQGYRVEANIMAAHIISTDYPTTNGVTIYDASADLISDLNDDGFFHRFSITIDADTVYDVSYVYAKLYLSFEGGPWNEYASSDTYKLRNDRPQDSFTIESELADGFPPGYYDVRIELYDADNDQWLLSYGPYDDPSLSALPLEDSYYDDSNAVELYPVETNIVVAGQGSMGIWLLLALPVILVALRKLQFESM